MCYLLFISYSFFSFLKLQPVPLTPHFLSMTHFYLVMILFFSWCQSSLNESAEVRSSLVSLDTGLMSLSYFIDRWRLLLTSHIQRTHVLTEVITIITTSITFLSSRVLHKSCYWFVWPFQKAWSKYWDKYGSYIELQWCRTRHKSLACLFVESRPLIFIFLGIVLYFELESNP